MALCLKIELGEVACCAALKAGYAVRLWVTRPNARKEKQVAHPAGMRVKPNGFWGGGGSYFFRQIHCSIVEIVGIA
jgi:hypothetical protein